MAQARFELRINMKLISFDASSKKTGVAEFNNGELNKFFLIDYSEIKDRDERTKLMVKSILEELNIYHPDIIVIEDSWNAANVDVTKLLTLIMGSTFGWAVSNNSEWHTLLPSQWRRLCNIDQGKKKREELKQESITYVFNEYGITVNDDVADAVAIGRGYINCFE